jgi:hypothetical protein
VDQRGASGTTLIETGGKLLLRAASATATINEDGRSSRRFSPKSRGSTRRPFAVSGLGGARPGRPEGFSPQLTVNRPTGNYVGELGAFTLFGGRPKEKNVEGIRLAT